MILRLFKHIDWWLVLCTIPIVAAGLVTLHTFSYDTSVFQRQLLWVIISYAAFFTLSFIDLRFLKKSSVLFLGYLFGCLLLLSLFILGITVKGATSWLSFGAFALQPADLMKLLLVLVLAKYFSRRHVEMKKFKHTVISGMYMLIPFVLVFLQPDFGSAIIIFLIWAGMILVAGISRKNLIILMLIGGISMAGVWFFGFEDYQRNRITSFLNPLEDIRGSGYNAYQSMIAVGSGQITGKGLGYGTQSRLQFLPEYQTDFIFAAFAEEWGLIGSLLLMVLYIILLWRVIRSGFFAQGNFEALYAVGVAIYFFSHIFINIGMNINLMPVTGITLPLVSRGGSHLLTEFMALGILMSMQRFRRSSLRHKLVADIDEVQVL